MTYYNGYWYHPSNDKMFKENDPDEKLWENIREKLNEIIERELENEQISESTDN